MPRGVNESTEVALIVLQDDTNNQVVAPSAMLWIELHVEEDVSDYDMLYVAPPNDKYITEDKLEDLCQLWSWLSFVLVKFNYIFWENV